jgi:hypothetical protein
VRDYGSSRAFDQASPLGGPVLRYFGRVYPGTHISRSSENIPTTRLGE